MIKYRGLPVSLRTIARSSLACLAACLWCFAGCLEYQDTGVVECDSDLGVEQYQCPDGSHVPWCACVDGTFECLESPEDGCAGSVCDDGSPVICEMDPPECWEWEELAALDGCWVCVDPATCLPWDEPGCGTDVEFECPPDEYCNPCARSKRLVPM